MKKLKNCKIPARRILSALSLAGMVAGFFMAICQKRKTPSLIVFLSSLAGFAAGVGMEMKLIPEPSFMKKLEIEIDTDDRDAGEDSFDPGEIFDAIDNEFSSDPCAFTFDEDENEPDDPAPAEPDTAE